jgi:riboflavin kinase/FMN adenylyltransferase
VKVYRGLAALRSPSGGTVVTLGVFDGVHVGHRFVVRRAVRLAGRRDLGAAAITFANHPDRVLRARRQPSITSLEHRLELLAELGLDACLVLSFTPRLAAMGAEDFVRKVIVQRLRAAAVVVGFDCRFGKGARGRPELLQAAAAEHGYEVRVCRAAVVGGLVASSTAIRNALSSGDLLTAERMLGRRIALRGKGRTLKDRRRHLFHPEHEALPPPGAYAARFRWNCTWKRATLTIPEDGAVPRRRPLVLDGTTEARIRRGAVVHVELLSHAPK